MSVRIFKFPVRRGGTLVPDCIRVLCVQMQGDQPTVWAEVIENCGNTVEVESVMTGAVMVSTDGYRYVSTIVGIDNRIVAHFYARGEILNHEDIRRHLQRQAADRHLRHQSTTQRQ